MPAQTKLALFKNALAYGGIHNLTPHPVTVAGVTYPPSGLVARVEAEFSPIVDGTTTQTLGKVVFVRDGKEVTLSGYEFEGTVNIVSGLVFEATKDWTVGCWVAPATGHPEVVRNDKGHIISVPAFIL